MKSCCNESDQISRKVRKIEEKQKKTTGNNKIRKTERKNYSSVAVHSDYKGIKTKSTVKKSIETEFTKEVKGTVMFQALQMKDIKRNQ